VAVRTFAVGQIVQFFSEQAAAHIRPRAVQVIRVLPEERDVFQYRIKSQFDAQEDQLTHF